MVQPEISIILPGIRKDNWNKVYDSIQVSTKRTFELIICGPHSLTPELEQQKNVKLVRDFGSPVRASNLAGSLCEGKLVTWTADDALFLGDGALEKNIDTLLHLMNNKKNDVVVSKYYEGKNGTNKPLQNDEYFRLSGSDWTRSQYIPKNWWLFNVAIMHKEFFEELGGWDCNYEGTFYAHADMAVRAQYLGANVRMSDVPLLDCDHDQSDHSPIEVCQTTSDRPKFLSKYTNPTWAMGDMKLDINNWKDAPAVWQRRFK